MFERFLSEVRDESTGGMKGFGSVAIRRLGAMNRRFMWPGYEAKARRNLIKAGEPQGYKPEDIMALQEISAVVGLLAASSWSTRSTRTWPGPSPSRCSACTTRSSG